MKTKESLKTKIESFSELERNWVTHNEEEITIESIMAANNFLDTLPTFVDIQTVDVFPMRSGGVQIKFGNYREVEIFNNEVTEYWFDNNANIINKHSFVFNYTY